MTEPRLFALTTLFSACFCSSNFSFQNVTIKWTLQTHQYVTPGKPTNNLKELFPENGVTDGLTTVFINGSVNTLYQNSVTDIPDLACLDMTRVNLQKIEPGAFKKLPVLSHLDFGENSLEEIQSGTFVDLQSCHYINVSSNQISVLEVGAFRNLSNLSRLYLSKNKIDKVERGVFDNVTVRILDLSQNVVSKLEDGFLDNVLPVKGLNVYLVLSDNKLEEVNPRVFNHSYITHLYLANNSVSSLRLGDFQNLPKLEYLQLRGNKLENIENVFNNMKLISLDLSHNEISFIASDAFRNMTKLRIVRLNHNKIKFWDNNWFQDSEAITTIFASNNLIGELPEKAFKNYQNTFSIDLAANRIENIKDLAFYNPERGFTRLHYLILRDNLIQKWNKFLLVNRANITVYGIDLRKNKLECFQGSVNDNFGKVEVVWLSDNAFGASCGIEIEQYVDKHKAYHTPEELEEEMIY
ncbi:vasorin-like [Zophobas morio]|uniref:vasorin-like n=1 Tax=Zophobas morio TaxID=2755281 RepID=UPI00308391F1